MDQAERVRELVEGLLEEAGLELVDVEVGPGLLRLSVDRPGGVDLEVISAVSPAVSAALDAGDPVAGAYQLEVSSPGLERPLRRPEHFKRFVGSKVTLRTVAGVEGDRRATGILTVADDDGVELSPDDGRPPRRIGYAQIERARTVFEWGPSPRPGAPGQSRSRRKAAS
ncbi:MAG TPA: ribosome maturation factor RimP [Acidimicrobiales bacterium]|nr:ribosome maturation factor RimP [Acidimicrobiales bacterium]